MRVAITFDTKVQNKAKRFSIPANICHQLRVMSGDEIALAIRDTSGSLLYKRRKPLKSGREIYGPDIRECVEAGQPIRVTVSLP